MKIFAYGNPALRFDNAAPNLFPFLKRRFPSIDFVLKDTVEEIKEKNPVILDVCEGIKKTIVVDDLGQLQTRRPIHVHDFGLEQQLALLLKIGKIRGFKIICIPEKPDKEEVVAAIREIVKNR